MSKPQLAMVETGSYRQLTVREVAERIQKRSASNTSVSRKTKKARKDDVRDARDVLVDLVPEHLF